jgi:AraC family transcriptional regulator
MSEKQVIPQHTSALAFETYAPTAPILSSVQAGWEGIIVRTYHEPTVVESVIAPAVPDISLVMVTRGAMRFESRDVGGSWEAFTTVEGDWFLTPGGGRPYELRWSSLSSEPIQTLHVHVSTDLVARAALQLADRDPARVELVERSGFQDPLLAQMGLALRQELLAPAPVGKLYAETAAQMLAVHLLRHYLATDVAIKDVSRGLTSSQMKRIIDYIQAHLNQDLSLEALAQQIGFSAYHFARLFRQTTGESPHRFVLHKRIEAAQRLLKETDLPLAQIALEVGFPDQSHFTHAFKRRLGLTPYKYRQESWNSARFR